MDYTIERKVKGTRTFFYPTVNGHRISSTNYARKYDARNLITLFREKYSEEAISAMIARKAAK